MNEHKYLSTIYKRKSVVCAVCHDTTHILNVTKYFVFCRYQFCYSFFLFPFHFFFVILSFITKLPDGQLLVQQKCCSKKCTWHSVKILNTILSIGVLQNSWASCRVLSLQSGWLLFKCVNCDGIILSLPKISRPRIKLKWSSILWKWM